MYDDNGSMTEGHYKGIVTAYNHLVLPVYIAKGGDSILMTYDAGGTLLRKQHKSGSTVVMTRDYIGGIEYVNDTLDAIYHSEGRIKYIDEVARYEYYIRDHLGNIRLTCSDLNADGLITTPDEILEEMHYYPYGMMMEGSWMGDAGQYGYNGIEYENFLDLEMNLATYRGLDPALGRWWQVDPKGEHDYASSPYVSNYNNPVSFSDPEGDCPICPAIPFIVGGLVGGTSNVINQALKGNIGSVWEGLGYFGSGAVSGALDVASPGLGRITQPVLNKVQQGITGDFALSDLGNYGAGDWLMFGLDVGTDALTGGTSKISNTLSTKWINSISGGANHYWVNRSVAAAHIVIEPVEIVARKTVEKTTINSVAAGTGSNIATQGAEQLLLQAPKTIAKHHIFPQQFRSWFSQQGLKNIDDYTVPLEHWQTHIKGVHGKGLRNMPGRWNQQWQQFMKNNPNANPSQIFKQAEDMLHRFGLEHLRYGPY